ncbi:hypothetical protein NGM99_21260 [Mesorhizobium sp. RP14(2022)]|uniref:Uncharacterized protein n=1 Tax=Mesorhizobium liriopis TaxID=2953882 RepID=A0ABT1CBW3_9HYPH|nr:hypothetical protein [Mesorhizobium liriopis]MCO6052322.1 hypothetical protein [Mesorhizobium liriopis]
MEYTGEGIHIRATGIGEQDQFVVEAHSKLVAEHIKSQTRMRLGLYTLAALFMIVAALLVVFAPDGRQASTIVVAGALIIVSAGVAGFAALKLKAPAVELTAGNSQIRTERRR